MFRLRPDKPENPDKVNADIEKMSQAIHSVNHGKIPADVTGSYTGTPRDGGVPTQDADDL